MRSEAITDDVQPLDLRLPDDLLQPDETDTDLVTKQRILPDLFQSSPNDPKTKVSGSLILDEEEQALQDSVSGMQVTVETRID
jgi:hypothetical protein